MGDGQAEVSGGWCNVMLSQGSLEMFGFVVKSDVLLMITMQHNEKTLSTAQNLFYFVQYRHIKVKLFWQTKTLHQS